MSEMPRVAFASGWSRMLNPNGPDGSETYVHETKRLMAIRGHENGRWHLSVSHRERIPTWGELGFARDHLLPANVWLMIAHPPREYWMNLNSRVLHLWEFDDPHLIGQFMWEGAIARELGTNVPDDGVRRMVRP